MRNTHKFVVHPESSEKPPIALLMRQIAKNDYTDFFILTAFLIAAIVP
jgi:hypothetical protein